MVGDCEDRYDQIEHTVLNPKIQDICREKQSPEFVSKLDGFVLRLEDELMNFRDVEYRGCTLSEKEIIDLFYFKFLDVPLLSRMHSVAEYFIDQVETLRDRDLSDEEREEVMNASEACTRQETVMCCTAVFLRKKDTGRFHTARLRSAASDMKMYIRCFILSTHCTSAETITGSSMLWWMRCRIIHGSSIC